jgi:hypothetical protein
MAALIASTETPVLPSGGSGRAAKKADILSRGAGRRAALPGTRVTVGVSPGAIPGCLGTDR